MNEAGARDSVWTATAPLPTRPPLDADAHVDVAIVGAGIAGMSCAYLLACEGMKVMVLDDGPVGGGMTCRTTAHLSNAVDDRFYNVQRRHGRKGNKLVAESHTLAINRIESNVIAEGIDCDFERLDGYMFMPPGEPLDKLDDDLGAARAGGIPGVERVSRAPLHSFDTGPCNRFPRQGQFHPIKYLAGLALAIEKRGGRIHCGSHVAEVHDGKPARAVTRDGRTVTCDAIIVATNTPINDRFAIHTKQAPYMTHVIGARVPKGSVPRALYWDLDDPYHYIRLASGTSPEHDVLIVGGEDTKTGHDDDPSLRHAALVDWTKSRFPAMGNVEYAWSGQVMEPADGVAFIGRNPGDTHVYVVTGDSGMGMTHGTIASMLLTDLILGRENSWEDLYSPSRLAGRAPITFARENLDVAARWVGDRIHGGDVKGPEEIGRDCGALLRDGVHVIAAYRDEQGALHERSAVCPHLGCIVAWNGTEKTWDCPCHGSRFDRVGKVISGPANTDLPPAPARS